MKDKEDDTLASMNKDDPDSLLESNHPPMQWSFRQAPDEALPTLNRSYETNPQKINPDFVN